jgi:hypothetical protein
VGNNCFEGVGVKILIVFTSQVELGKTGKKAGFLSREFVAPYHVFGDVNVQIALVSSLGGKPPIDPTNVAMALASLFTIGIDYA